MKASIKYLNEYPSTSHACTLLSYVLYMSGVLVITCSMKAVL